MTSIVVDASLALKWALDEDLTPGAQALLQEWIRQGIRLIAPSLFAYKIAHVLYRQQRANIMTTAQALLAYQDVCNHVDPQSLDDRHTARAFAIGNETDRPDAYDVHYLALAEREECEYWTADERLW